MADGTFLREVICKWVYRFEFTRDIVRKLSKIIDSPHRAEALNSLFSAIDRKDAHLVEPFLDRENMFLARILLGARDYASHIASSSVLKIIVEFDQSRNIYIVRAVDIVNQ